MDFSKLAGLSRFMNLSTSDLTIEVVRDIAKVFGKEVDVTDDTVRAIADLARENNVDKLADVLGKPETMKRVMEIIMAPPPSAKQDDDLIICPHCSEYICLNR